MKTVDLGLYIWDGVGEPEHVLDTMEWAERLEADLGKHYQLAEHHIGHYRISTVFLAIDHNHLRNGPPILWETMVFNMAKPVTIEGRRYGHAEWDGYMARYHSKAEAMEGHKRAVKLAKEQIAKE